MLQRFDATVCPAASCPDDQTSASTHARFHLLFRGDIAAITPGCMLLGSAQPLERPSSQPQERPPLQQRQWPPLASTGVPVVLQQEITAAFVHRLELVEDFVILAEEFGFCDNFNDIVFTVYLLLIHLTWIFLQVAPVAQTMLDFFLLSPDARAVT